MELLENILDGSFFMRWFAFCLLLAIIIRAGMHTGGRFREMVVHNLGRIVLCMLFFALVLALLFNAKGCDGGGRSNGATEGGTDAGGGGMGIQQMRTIILQRLNLEVVRIEWQGGSFAERCGPSEVHEVLGRLIERLKESGIGRQVVLECGILVPTAARLAAIRKLQERGFYVTEATVEE